MEITYNKYILPTDYIDTIACKYELSYKETCKEIYKRERDKSKILKKKLEALRLTRHYLLMELSVMDETLRMGDEDFNINSIPLLIKKKRKRKKKKNYCKCCPDSIMCFCLKPNGDYVKSI